MTPSLQHHCQLFRQLFHRGPKLYCTDRGFFSEQNLEACANGGVATISIPQRGGGRTPEREACQRSRAFKDGQRFRAGIEGGISVLMRGRGMKRCLAQGAERFELLVGAAVLTNNLMRIAELLIKRAMRRAKRTNK